MNKISQKNINQPFQIIAILAFFLFFSFTVVAQQGNGQGSGQGGERPAIGILKGKVIDKSNNNPVEYATISIHSLRDSSIVTGGITDSKGQFQITEIQLGMYFVKVGFLGYETRIISPIKLSPKGDGIEQDLGEIVLTPSSMQINEVDVVAEKMVVTNAIDKKVFNVSQSFSSNISSAAEILQNIPSIDVDIDGNVSLRGSGNVKILIDGKPSGLSSADLMEQIPASSIESIEVITNPSAKYDPEGMSGIINIVLKKNKLTGINGMVSVGFSNPDIYNTSAQISVKNKNLNVYANYSLRTMERGMEGLTYRETSTNSQISSILDQDYSGTFNFFSQMLKAGFDYNFNAKNSISFSALYNTREHNFGATNDNKYFDGTKILTETSLRNSLSENKGEGYDLNFNYLRKFEKKGHELSFDLNTSNHDMDNSGNYSEDFVYIGFPNIYDNSLEKDYGTGLRKYLVSQLDYVLPATENSKFEAGLKFQNSDMKTTYTFENFNDASNEFEEDSELENNFNYNEKIYAGYAIYGKKFGIFSFQAGLRLEQTMTDFTLLNSNQDYNNQYFSYYPSAHIQYEPKQGETFQLSYSKRVNRPNSRTLNPRVRYIDPLNLSAGNPYLMPEYINSIELGYMRYWEKYSITSSVYYRKITDMITQITTVNEEGISMTTFNNLASGSNYGFEFVFNASPYKWWNFTLSSNIYRSTIDGSNLDVDMNNEGTIFTTKLMSTWKVGKLFDMQLAGRYRGPEIMPQGEEEQMITFDIALKKSFLKNRANFSIRLSDMFDTEINRSILNGSNYYQTSERKRESRLLMFNFTYSFGKLSDMSKKKKRGENGEMESGDDMMDM